MMTSSNSLSQQYLTGFGNSKINLLLLACVKIFECTRKKIARPVQTRIKFYTQFPVGLSTVETQTMVLHSNSARSDITPLDIII